MQLQISGGVVNVPANVNSTITCLPRSLNGSYTVPIKLQRRLGPYSQNIFQGIVMYEQ